METSSDIKMKYLLLSQRLQPIAWFYFAPFGINDGKKHNFQTQNEQSN